MIRKRVIRTKLFKHQKDALEATADLRRVAYYHDMGLGKTYTGAEKMRQLGGRVNLVICQKSKVSDWFDHFDFNYYSSGADKDIMLPHDLTNKFGLEVFENNLRYHNGNVQFVGIINYDLIFRRPELLKIKYDTILLDESSMIQNDSAKRTKTILKLDTENVILLSGTPTGGKYENLYSQLKLLGWKITKKQYWNEFIETRSVDMGGFKIQIVTGYKNVERLKRKMREYGCHFLKTDEVFDLPQQTFTDISVNTSSEYRKFTKNKVVEINGREMIGDTTLKEMLYQRQLCGAFNGDKLSAVQDILESTTDRVIVFYNFNDEFTALNDLCVYLKRPVSVCRGGEKDLEAYSEIQQRNADSVSSRGNGFEFAERKQDCLFHPAVIVGAIRTIKEAYTPNRAGTAVFLLSAHLSAQH